MVTGLRMENEEHYLGWERTKNVSESERLQQSPLSRSILQFYSKRWRHWHAI